MSSIQPVFFHSTRFPESIPLKLHHCLASNEMEAQFHYITNRQAQRWLDLHQQYSPSRTDKNCQTAYSDVFTHCANKCANKSVHVVGLGCGGGQKDLMLIQALYHVNCSVRYTAVDTSPALTLTATQCVRSHYSNLPVRCFVTDLLHAEDLFSYWREWPLSNSDSNNAKSHNKSEIFIFSFLGMLPNFPPLHALQKLSSWMTSEDYFIVSANLAPGDNALQGCQKILPLYDNSPTQQWLLTLLEDLGFPLPDLDLKMGIGFDTENQIHRIEAIVQFKKTFSIIYENKTYSFVPEKPLLLFYSNRHTPDLICQHFQQTKLQSLFHSLIDSEEEGVWMGNKIRKN